MLNIERLKTRMTELGANCSKLARWSGVSVGTIRRLLDGDGSPTIATVEKICRAVSLEPLELFIHSGEQAIWNLKRDVEAFGLRFNVIGEMPLDACNTGEDPNVIHIHTFHEMSSDSDSVRFVSTGEFRWNGQWVELFRDETEWCPRRFVKRFVKQYDKVNCGG